jgi:AhpD family alkylhydroperoxidase
VDEPELDAEARALIASAERTGAPDPRVVRIMVRSSAGRAWVKCWNSVLYEGKLPHRLKEMCRIRISVAHRCGYCSTVRSNVARAEGLDEALVSDLLNQGTRLSPREKAAIEYADLFKSGDEAIDSDAVYARLRKHFSEEEIIELGMLCAQTVGVGRFVRSLNIVSWEEACELNPALSES